MTAQTQPTAEQVSNVPARPLGPNESTYTREPQPDGSVRFTVVGAKGPQVFWPMLLIAPVVCAWFAQVARAWPIGLLFGLVFGLIYVIGRHSTLSGLRQRRAPAGAFSVSTEGMRLMNGAFVPRTSIRRVVVRNGMSGHITTWFGGSGAMGAAAAIGAARQAREAAQFETIAYQLELEAEGRSVPVVGSMTAATAEAVFEDVSAILGLIRR